MLPKIFKQKLASGYSQTYKNYGVYCEILFIVKLILLANTPTPDLA